ncbi:MAG TPA: hypothetical protein VNW49_01200 [Puia sp.]|nr:hypothetical protein [Puia sp.]
MNTFIRKKSLIIALVLFSKHINAQNYNDYRDAQAVMLRVNGNVYSEKKLEGAIIALHDNSNQLVVRLQIPYSSINENASEDTATSLPDYHFNLRMKIDSWKTQESLTSGKTFETDGYLTLNHITKLVLVEYAPLPSMTVQDGAFNLNLIIGFNPADFNLGVRDINTRLIIRIGDAPVNRL